MTNVLSYPLQDWYETTLSEAMDTSQTSMKVATAPDFTFPSWITTYWVINPWKTNQEIVKLESITSNTFTITTRNISQWEWVTTTAQSHSVGSKVIISDNFKFWEDLVDSINTKIDGRTQWVYFYADSTARDSDLWGSPATDWLIAWLTSEWKITYSLWGSWLEWSTSSSSFVNASETVAWKVEVWTQTETEDWTETWGTWAVLTVNPLTLWRAVQKQSYTYDEDTWTADAYVITLSPAPTSYVEWMRFSVKIWAWNTNTTTSTINVNSLWVKTIKDRDWDDLWAWQLIAWQVYDLVYNWTNFVLQTIEKASDSDITTWTDDIKYTTPKQLKDNYSFLSDISNDSIDATSLVWTTTDITHWLWKTPQNVEIVTTFHFWNFGNISNWAYNWTEQGCNTLEFTLWSATTWSWNYSWEIIHIGNLVWTITAMDSSKITITRSWTDLGSWSIKLLTKFYIN